MKREIKFRYRFTDGENWIMKVFTLGQIINGDPFEVLSDSPLLKRYRHEGEDQWTGITDRNRVEVYHGDILRMYRHSDDTHKHEVGKVWHDGEYHGDIREVKYSLGTFYTKGTYGIDRAFMHMARPGESYEVIGNIHETPELLRSAIGTP